jgi:hypothetical protein
MMAILPWSVRETCRPPMVTYIGLNTSVIVAKAPRAEPITVI